MPAPALRRSFVLALALAVGSPLLHVPVAVAADAEPIPEAGIVAIVPPAEIPGDGRTEVQVGLVAVDPSGGPMPGLKLSPEASSGTVSGWRELSPGVYAFDYVAPAVEEATTVTLSASGRSVARGRVEASLDVQVVPARGEGLAATAKPAALVLGKADGATLLVESPRPVVFRTSAGAVEGVTDMGAKQTARFVAEKVNYPHVALITMADAADPGRVVGFTTVKLSGNVDYPVDVAPNAKVEMKVGGASYGPVDASPEGKAAVPIVVPPGVTTATVVSTVDGASTEEELDLRIPGTKRLALFPLPKVIPSDAGVSVPVRVAVVTPTGEPDAAAEPAFTVSAGTIGEVSHEGGGIYVAPWTPPAGDEAGTAVVTVKLEGKVQEDSVEVRLAPRRATAVTVSAEPEAIAADLALLKLKVSLESSGEPLEGRAPVVEVHGGEVEGSVVDAGGGVYGARVRIGGEGPMRIAVLAPADPTDNPLRHVVIVPGRERVEGGGGATGVVVATVDAFGYPVPGVEVELSVASGDGELGERKVTTDAHGLARLDYTAGSEAGLVTIRGTAGEISGLGALLQGPAGLAPLDVPVSGSDAVRAVVEGWRGSVAEVRLEGAAATAAAAAATELAPADAEVSTVEITAVPEAVRPGGEVRVTVVPRAEDGRAVPGQTLDFLTSAGTYGEVVEADGAYTATLSVPADATGEIKVSAVSESGAMKLVKVTVDPDAPEAPVLAKTAEPEPAKAEVAPKPVKVREPAEPGAVPWLRVGLRGVGSVYTYEQAPSTEPGPLLPRALAVGGASGGSPATPMGVELEARGWLEELPYVGFHGVFRSTGYSIASSAFENEANDWLYNVQLDVAGRYPFQIAGDSYWIGGKAGFHYNDFILFTGCLEPDCLVTYEPLGLPGLGLGAEMGAELAQLFFIAGYTHGFANFTVPYSSAVDVTIGYQLHPNAFADVGFSSLSRRVLLNGAESQLERGSLADQQLIFKVGGGVSF